MQNRWSPFRTTLGTLALALVVAGCSAPTPPAAAPAAPGGQSAAPGAAPAGGQPAAPAAQTIKRGGTFVTYSSASWAGSDPAMGQNAYQNWLWFGTYMLRRQPDTWKLDGDAIEKWAFSADGKELTLNVRQGMKWENKPPVNGREVEAKDIVYSLKSITGQQYPDMSPLRFPRKSNLEELEDATVVDKYTVKVKLKNPSPAFLDGMAEYRSPITPDGIREHFGGRDSLASPDPARYLTAGPFTLESYRDLTEAVMKRHPDYWEKGADGKSLPYLDQIQMLWITDTSTQVAAFISKQISHFGVNVPEIRNQVLGARKDAVVIEHQPTSCWYHMNFNTKRKPFDDVRVRRALVLTIDPVEIGKALAGEFNGKPVWRYSSPLPWSFPEALSQEEMAKHQMWESPKSQKTIDEAKKLMADAGYADGFSAEFISSTGAIADAMQLYISQINRVFPNIKFRANPLDNAINLERSAKSDFDARSYCYIHEPTPVAMMKTVWHSKGGRNVSQLSDPKMDAILDKAGLELDATKRTALLREAQFYAMEVASFWPTYHNVQYVAFQPEVRGVRLGAATNGLQMYSKGVWLDK